MLRLPWRLRTINPVLRAASISFLLFVVAWWFLTLPLGSGTATPKAIIDPVFAPRPVQVAHELFSEEMFDHLSISIFRTLVGLLLALLTALALSLMVATTPIFEGLLAPLSGLRYIPISAFVPLSIFWAGIGEFQKISIICLGCLLQGLPMYVAALRSVEQNYIDVGKVYQLSAFAITWRIRLRRSAPAIFDASRVLFGIGWSCLLIAEIVGATRGLGFLITQSQRYWRVDRTFAAMTWVGIIGLVFDIALIRLRKDLFPWESKLTSLPSE